MAFYIDMWKASVEVQKHFNDIEWRIRGLALTAATFALGAAGVAAKDGTRFGPVSLGAAILLLGLLLWYAFYYVDRYWYHVLLKAAVHEGSKFEMEITRFLPEANMTTGITSSSRLEVSWFMALLAGRGGTQEEDGVRYMHSDHKLKWFYRVGAMAIFMGAVGLQVAALTTPSVNLPAVVVP